MNRNVLRVDQEPVAELKRFEGSIGTSWEAESHGGEGSNASG